MAGRAIARVCPGFAGGRPGAHHRRVRRPLLLLAALAVLPFGACGGDGDAAGTGASTTAAPPSTSTGQPATACPGPADTSPVAAWTHDLCVEVGRQAGLLQLNVVPAVTGENALPPDGTGPDWDALGAYCGQANTDALRRLAGDGRPDPTLARLAQQVVDQLDGFLEACNQAVGRRDVDTLRSAQTNTAVLAQLATQIVRLDGGDPAGG
jgi:hypothetical protein